MNNSNFIPKLLILKFLRRGKRAHRATKCWHRWPGESPEYTRHQMAPKSPWQRGRRCECTRLRRGPSKSGPGLNREFR